MGHVINSLPPEQDKTRPKLMNLKFELVREAEENFEAELPIRLGSEVLLIKFVCKHTPWCTRCRWWFHTAEEDCPRAGEDETVSNFGARQRDVQSFHNQRVSDDRHIRSAARETVPAAEDRPQGATSTRGAGRLKDARFLSGGQSLARSSRSSTPQGGRGLNIQGTSRGGAISDVARILGPGAGTFQQQDLSGGMHLQGYAGGYQAYALPGGQMAWQGMGFRPYNPAIAAGQPYFYNMYGSGQGLNYVAHGVEDRRTVGGNRGRVGHAVRVEDSASPLDLEVVPVEERAGSERSRPQSPVTSTRAHSDMEESPGVIPEGVETGGRELCQFEEQVLLPLVCTLQDQAIHVVGLLDRNNNLVLPTMGLSEIPLQFAIREKVKYLFADRFEFRIFPEFYLPIMRSELEDGKSVKYAAVFIDARLSTEAWQGLRNVGLDTFPLEAKTQPSIDLLAEVIVEPGISASFLADLNPIMPRSSNLLSASFLDCLSA
ncbi:hypothetical protein CBR_g52416 [Chara braunii]|uniref:Uncharacterized protein n=1 Tax=Chara braunii TaxID=69332 RepID=A0A388MA59_CHABU|nr:hypothetical protein CBR_g52416 [Chara braunii]|eukprot:GBG91461.1 hypothetical protein CBR_g52416 [Chara braunii]